MTDDCPLCAAIDSLAHEGVLLANAEARIRHVHDEHSHSDDCPVGDAETVTYTVTNGPGTRTWDAAINADVSPSDIDRRTITITNHD